MLTDTYMWIDMYEVLKSQKNTCKRKDLFKMTVQSDNKSTDVLNSLNV